MRKLGMALFVSILLHASCISVCLADNNTHGDRSRELSVFKLKDIQKIYNSPRPYQRSRYPWNRKYTAIGDINGDRYDDLVVYEETAACRSYDGGYKKTLTGRLWYHLGNARGEATNSGLVYQDSRRYYGDYSCPNPPILHGPVTLLDVNGDGMADLIQDDKVRLATGSGQFGAAASIP